MDKQNIAPLGSQTVLTRLETSEQGLTQAQVGERLSQYGQNALRPSQHTTLDLFGRQFKSPLVYFLLGASVISLAIRDLSDGFIILAILAINTLLGFFQEYRSEHTIEQLSKLITRRTLVMRGGERVMADVTTLVPGDIVVLKEGDIIPADVKLLVAENLSVNESQLTGESAPVAKRCSGGAVPTGESAEDVSLLFAGSAVEQGSATGVIYATGADTELGRIATLSTRIRKVTHYEQSLQAFSALLIRIILLTLALAFLAKILITADLSHLPVLFLFIIALAIAVVPEALPVIATVTLSQGALKMAREQVIVKRLPSLEDLGNITLLCTDKTGTLTENRLAVQQEVSDNVELFHTLAYAAILPSDPLHEPATAEMQGVITPEAQTKLVTKQPLDAFDAALLAATPESIKRQATRFTKLQESPFDPAARRRRVIVADPTTHIRYLVVIGSAETLLDLARCPHAQAYRDALARDGAQGLRHLALAYAVIQLPNDDDVLQDDILQYEHDLTFLGYVALSDPIRPSAQQAIQMAEELGVAIKILSGDSKEVVGFVGRQIGLLHAEEKVVTGDEIAKVTPETLAKVALQTSMFARVTPEQKFLLIQALKTQHVVGYQGDGINDAPALKLADVAIAVDTATEVAKANADIILLKKDLRVIVNGIKYGRSIFANVNKYITYTMVGNFGNYFALAALYLLSFTLPLLPRQVLLISLITDVPLVTIATDSVADREIVRPEKYDIHRLMGISLVLGSLTALFELAFFATLRGAAPSASQTGLYLFLTVTQLVVIVSIRNKDHFWKAQRPSLLLMSAMALTGVVALALPYIGPLALLFSFTPLSLQEVATILLVAGGYLLVLDLVKVWYYQLVESHHTAHHSAAPSSAPSSNLASPFPQQASTESLARPQRER